MLIILGINLVILALVLWNVLAWPRVGPADGEARPTCSVLVPARNEQANIGPCLDAILRQGTAVTEVIVCDDHSTDATADIVMRHAGADPRVRLITAGELPAGWSGKTNACVALAAAANGQWLLFIDADSRLCDDAVARMLAEARRRDVTFLSCWPGLALGGFWEKTLMPMLNFVVFTLFPAPRSLVRNDPSLGLAHGVCILARREDYHALGGHRIVAGEIFEDTCLARQWRRSGRRGVCLDGQDLIRVRMYDSLSAILQGFGRIFFPAFRRTISFWLFIAFHTVCFLLPFVLLAIWAARGIWWPTAALAAATVLLMRLLFAVRFGYPPWSVLLHPLAQVLLITTGIGSWWRCRFGRGVQWKGRTYHGRKPAEGAP